MTQHKHDKYSRKYLKYRRQILRKMCQRLSKLQVCRDNRDKMNWTLYMRVWCSPASERHPRPVDSNQQLSHAAVFFLSSFASAK